MIKGKLVVVSNLTTFKTIQQSSDPIPDSAIVFIKNEGQIWTKGSYFGVQKTYDVVSKTDAGLAPKGGDSASSLIANVDDEWVLTVTNGANPSWRKLPANAFKNQTYTFYNLAFKNSSGTTVDTYKPSTSPSKSVKAGTNVKISASSNTITISATDTTYNPFTGASDSTDGSLGLVPKPTKGNQSKFLKADGSWATPTDTTYPIVTSTKDGLVPKFDANDGTIDQLDKDWVLTNNNGSIGWYKLPANAFNNSTYSLVNNSSNGLVPILPTTNSTTISTQADEWVLTTTKGGEPSWRKLPTTAFYSLPTAKTNTLGGIKVGSVSTSAFADLTGKYYTVNVDKNGVAYVNVPWTDTPYTLPTASSTLGGVKTTSTVTSTTGLTACPIIDGVVYYKDSDSNTWRGIYVGGTSKMGTANNTKALNFAAGNNVTISYAAPGTASGQSGNASYGTLTINATNTWTAWKGATSSANGTAGYMPAPTSALRNQFLRGDGTWQSLNNYSLPTASSSTLGGVKTGAAITDTTGYTPVHIKDGVIYYKDTNSTNYLPLAGGTITSSNISPLLVKGTNTSKSVTIRLLNSDRSVADFGHTTNDGVYIQDFISGYYIGVKQDGTPYYHNGSFRTILHESNYSNYALPLSGGEMTGVVTFKNFGGLPLVGKKGNNIVFTLGSGSSDTTEGTEYGILLLFHSGSEKIRIYANPNYKSWMDVYRLGIGTSNPEYKLHIVGDTYINGKLLTKAFDSGTDGTSSNDVYIEGKGNGSLRIQYYKTSTTWDLLKMQNGVLSFNDLKVYHGGNLKTFWGLSISNNGSVSGNLHLGNGSDYEIGTGYSVNDTIRYNNIIYGYDTTGLQFNSGKWTTRNDLITHKFNTYHCDASNPALYIVNNGDVKVSNTFYSNLVRSKTNDVWMIGYDSANGVVSLGSSASASTIINGQESVRISSWRNSNMTTVLDLDYNGVHSNSAFKVYDTSDYQYIQVGPPTSNHAVFDNHSNLGRGASIAAYNNSAQTLGVIGINSLGKPFYTNGLGNSYDLIHSGNIGSYSSGSSQTSSNINGVLYFNNSSYVGEGSQGNHNVSMFTYEDLYLYCRYGHSGGSPWTKFSVADSNSASITFGGKTHTEFKNSIGNTQLHISQSFTILGYSNPQNGLHTYVDGTEIHMRYGANHAYETTFCSDSYVNVPALKIGGQALTFVT